MRSWELMLGGEDAVVFSPERGEFDSEVFRAVFPDGGLYGLDVETTALTDLSQWDPEFRIRLVQFATVGYSWVLDMEDPDQRSAAVELLSNSTVTFCSHENMDVLSVHAYLGVDISDRNVDTLVLSHMSRTGDMHHGLKLLSDEYLGPELSQAEESLHKVFHSLWTGSAGASKETIHAHGWTNVSKDNPEYLKYSGLDPIACRRIAPVLISVGEQPAKLIDREIWLSQECNRIQMRGFRVDAKMLDEVEEEAKEHTTRTEVTIQDITGLKARSPKLLQWFSKNGVDPDTWVEHGGTLTKKGTPSLAKESVRVLSTYPLSADGEAVFEALEEFKGWQDRLLKTNAIRKYLAPDGHVHAVLRSNGAHQTSRMSSASPNMQNFSKKDPRTRGVFIPKHGCTFVTCDFDQVELRVVAALAREERMIEAILSGADLHQLTADAVLRPRPIGKLTNFLTVYGGGGPALASKAGLQIDDARDVVRRFREAYPGITRYSYELAEYTAIRTVSNRRLEAPGAKDGRVRAYANINYMVQSSAREFLLDAWWRLVHEFGRHSMVWLPIHDELVLEVPNDLVEQVIREIEQCMTFEFMGVPITATANVLLDANGVSRWGK